MRFSAGVREPLGSSRGFVHKRIGGAIVGGVKGFVRGGPGGVVGGAVGGFVGGGAPTGRAAGCPPGFRMDAGGNCVARVSRVPGVRGFAQRVIPGGETGFETRAAPRDILTPHERRRQATDIARHGFSNQFPIEEFPLLGIHGGLPPGGNGAGAATVGRFGAGMEPSVRMLDVRTCARGAVLAVDGLCYNRRDLRNSERAWPRGRRPLLTGGEMRAISVASSAAKKLQRKQKQLESLGLLKRPMPRRQKLLPAGHAAQPTHVAVS